MTGLQQSHNFEGWGFQSLLIISVASTARERKPKALSTLHKVHVDIHAFGDAGSHQSLLRLAIYVVVPIKPIAWDECP